MLDRAHLSAPGDMPDVLAETAAVLGWTARLFLADDGQSVLIPVRGRTGPAAQDVGGPLSIDGTLAGRAFRLVEPVAARDDGQEVGLWVPLLDGVHRFGVIRFGFPPGTDLGSAALKDAYRLVAENTGHLVAAKSAYGDALRRITRLRERSVASELLWDLLPPLPFGCTGLVLSAILEPTYDVAADAFDYSVVDGVAYLAVLDATGHDLRGTVLVSVALAALRNARRHGRGLYDAVQLMDELVATQGRGEAFVTGVVAELDLTTGRLRYINCGHPSPLLLRDGKVVTVLEGGRRIVLGLGEGQATVAQVQLEAGDRVVFYTDGITEARSPTGAFFGLQRLVDHLERSAAGGLPAPETLRLVVRDVLHHQADVLQDDATVLVAEWAAGAETR